MSTRAARLEDSVNGSLHRSAQERRDVKEEKKRVRILKPKKRPLLVVYSPHEKKWVAARAMAEKKVKYSVTELRMMYEKTGAPYYSPEDVAKMDDCSLALAFCQITGNKSLRCIHCGIDKKNDWGKNIGRESSLRNWTQGLRKRGLKCGIYCDMPVPKTCDKQQSVNAMSNPINNKIYPHLRNPMVSDESKSKLLEVKKGMFDTMGIGVNPCKYNYSNDV